MSPYLVMSTLILFLVVLVIADSIRKPDGGDE